MKLLSFFLLIATATAFAPALQRQRRNVSLNAVEQQSRKAFLGNAAASLVLVTSTAANAKDSYSLDTGSVAVPEKEKPKTKEGASNLVLGVAGGSIALSLPFFLPSILRLLGYKNTKMP
mmetsp:Transcript_1047/g.2272  ORF Transcript_1047/g.2272 Transcript_1047/m.2272 type:complete len:119 (+) Transcript_1047:134-490(+)